MNLPISWKKESNFVLNSAEFKSMLTVSAHCPFNFRRELNNAQGGTSALWGLLNYKLDYFPDGFKNTIHGLKLTKPIVQYPDIPELVSKFRKLTKTDVTIQK